MFEINGKNIRLTRGDTAVIHVDIVRKLSDGTFEEYSVKDGDVLVLSARRACAPHPCLQIVAKGSAELMFKPAATAELAADEYIYDIQLTTSDKDVYTVVDDGRLTLTRGVTA